MLAKNIVFVRIDDIRKMLIEGNDEALDKLGEEITETTEVKP